MQISRNNNMRLISERRMTELLFEKSYDILLLVRIVFSFLFYFFFLFFKVKSLVSINYIHNL